MTEHLGASAILYAGFGVRDHARAAIQSLSGEISEVTVYAHLGWRKIGNVMAYLHSGGALGPQGPLRDIEVELPEPVSGYRLPPPPDGNQLNFCVRASLDLLRVAPLTITAPILSATYRASLGPSDYALHLTGSTGAGKTELAALAQQHYGDEMDARNLPGSWSSTGNALEGLAFLAKDALMTADDFAPTGGSRDVQRLNRDADRILRAQGNRSARQRLGRDGLLRPGRPPRGTILSTGEDVPRGHSIRARLLVLQVEGDSVNWTRLTESQSNARSGVLSASMSGFLSWVARAYSTTLERLKEISSNLASDVDGSLSHRRTPRMAADLGAGLKVFLAFAVEVGAVTEEEEQTLWNNAWRGLKEVTEAQTREHSSAEPTARFLSLLVSALGSGRAHIADPKGREPQQPEAWGWRVSGVVTPLGDRIGWIVNDDLFLDPEAAFAAVEKFAREAGEDSLGVSSITLRRRLCERGLLLATEQRGRQKRLTVRKNLEGRRRSVLHLSATSLSADDPPVAQQAHGAVPTTASQCKGTDPTGHSLGHSNWTSSSVGPATGPAAANQSLKSLQSEMIAGPLGPHTQPSQTGADQDHGSSASTINAYAKRRTLRTDDAQDLESTADPQVDDDVWEEL